MSERITWKFLRILFLLHLLQGSMGLRNVYTVIPEAAERGKAVVLRCMYDLENEDLYQVKWYRGDREFYRYAPRDVPPVKVFPISGIEVDRLLGTDYGAVKLKAHNHILFEVDMVGRIKRFHGFEIKAYFERAARYPNPLVVEASNYTPNPNAPLIKRRPKNVLDEPDDKLTKDNASQREASDAQQLTLKEVTRRAHGRYTCEVSADAPSFLTAQVHGSMYVVDLPKKDPELIGLKRRYKPGMKLKVECISYDSMPPANLSFFINSEPALSQHVWHRVGGGENGSLWTAYSTIQFVVQKHHFIRGKIKIRCSAYIYSIYFRSHEQVADEERVIHTTIAPLPETREAMVFPIHRVSDNSGTCIEESAAKGFLQLMLLVLAYYIVR